MSTPVQIVTMTEMVETAVEMAQAQEVSRGCSLYGNRDLHCDQ